MSSSSVCPAVTTTAALRMHIGCIRLYTTSAAAAALLAAAAAQATAAGAGGEQEEAQPAAASQPASQLHHHADRVTTALCSLAAWCHKRRAASALAAVNTGFSCKRTPAATCDAAGSSCFLAKPAPRRSHRTALTYYCGGRRRRAAARAPPPRAPTAN
jgi:hypothetical protein